MSYESWGLGESKILKTMRRLQRVLNAYAGADRTGLLVETSGKPNLYGTNHFPGSKITHTNIYTIRIMNQCFEHIQQAKQARII